jgi:hypothetical protein
MLAQIKVNTNGEKVNQTDAMYYTCNVSFTDKYDGDKAVRKHQNSKIHVTLTKPLSING